MNFIPCQKHDLEKLQAISKESYRQAFIDIFGQDNVNEYVNNTYSKENLLSELNQENNHFIFIENKNSVIGYGMYSIHSTYIKLERIYILSSFKGLGLGSLFMRYIEKIAKEEKKKICLEVLAENKKAKIFYEHKGFHLSGQKTVLIGKKECIILSMEKNIVSTYR